MKKLCRDTQNKMLSGVCSGIALYFDIDPTLVRLLWVIVTIFTLGFTGVILYIVCACIIPEKTTWDSVDYSDYTKQNQNTTYYNPPTDEENK